jgi:hypothetical protein
MRVLRSVVGFALVASFFSGQALRLPCPMFPSNAKQIDSHSQHFSQRATHDGQGFTNSPSSDTDEPQPLCVMSGSCGSNAVHRRECPWPFNLIIVLAPRFRSRSATRIPSHFPARLLLGPELR